MEINKLELTNIILWSIIIGIVLSDIALLNSWSILNKVGSFTFN